MSQAIRNVFTQEQIGETSQRRARVLTPVIILSVAARASQVVSQTVEQKRFTFTLRRLLAAVTAVSILLGLVTGVYRWQAAKWEERQAQRDLHPYGGVYWNTWTSAARASPTTAGRSCDERCRIARSLGRTVCILRPGTGSGVESTTDRSTRAADRTT